MLPLLCPGPPGGGSPLARVGALRPPRGAGGTRCVPKEKGQGQGKSPPGSARLQPQKVHLKAHLGRAPPPERGAPTAAPPKVQHPMGGLLRGKGGGHHRHLAPLVLSPGQGGRPSEGGSSPALCMEGEPRPPGGPFYTSRLWLRPCDCQLGDAGSIRTLSG